MTRNEMGARVTETPERPLEPSATHHSPVSRRDVLAQVFGWTAVVAAATIHTPADALSDDVFDGGTP